MTKKITKFIIIILSLLLINIPLQSVFAQSAEENGSYDFNTQSGLEITSNEAGYTEEIKNQTLDDRISSSISAVLAILGILFLILMIYAGIIWMTAAGNEEKVKKAKELLTEAIIGLAVVIAAYAISWFIFTAFNK